MFRHKKKRAPLPPTATHELDELKPGNGTILHISGIVHKWRAAGSVKRGTHNDIQGKGRNSFITTFEKREEREGHRERQKEKERAKEGEGDRFTTEFRNTGCRDSMHVAYKTQSMQILGAAWPNWNPRSVRQLQTVTVTRFRNCLEHLITNSSQVFRWPELRVELHAWHLTLCPFVFCAYNARVSRLMWTFLDFDAGNVAWNNSFLCTGICGKETIVLFLFFHMFDFVTRLLSFVNVVKDKILWLVRNFLIKC